MKRDGVCTLAFPPQHTACSVSDNLPSGECDQGACHMESPPDVSWRWRPGHEHWRINGRALWGGVLLAEITSPWDVDFDPPSSVCYFTRFNPADLNQKHALHEGTAPCDAWVLHQRVAVGTRVVPGGGQRVWTLLPLDESGPARDFDLDAQLAARLTAEGVTAAAEKPHGVQGVPGQLLLAMPLKEGKTWVASFSLDTLDFAWTRLLVGTLARPPIADEHGQLYLALDAGPTGPRRVVSLTAEGVDRWTLPGDGRPVAVFRDTLFLSDGSVHATQDGASRYTWPATEGAYVLLSETRAAAVAPCDATNSCTRVTLMRRDTGAVLTEASVKGTPNDSAAAQLTEDGAVLLLQRIPRPEMTASPYYPVASLRQHLVREGQPPQILSELVSPEGENIESGFLFDGQWVAVERDAFHNTYAPGADLVGIPAPGLRAPEHGWLTPLGNFANGSAPE